MFILRRSILYQRMFTGSRMFSDNHMFIDNKLNPEFVKNTILRSIDVITGIVLGISICSVITTRKRLLEIERIEKKRNKE
jgi:hypothetical protein